MRRRTAPVLVVTIAAILASAGVLAAHDLFLKPTRFRARPHTTLDVAVLNGTFTTSEAGVSRDRIVDLSLAGPGGRTRLDTTAWTPGVRQSVLAVRVGPPGTYVVGASLRPRELTMGGADFGSYLEGEGLGDVAAQRARDGTAADSVRERYSKHVKALVQVGDARSDAFGTVLDYPAEIVPLANPYALRRGATLRVRCLVEGAPAAGVTVIAGGRTRGGARLRVQRVTADADGIAPVRLTAAGQYYVKFISMIPVRDGEVQYESKWATLTFEVR